MLHALKQNDQSSFLWFCLYHDLSHSILCSLNPSFSIPHLPLLYWSCSSNGIQLSSCAVSNLLIQRRFSIKANSSSLFTVESRTSGNDIFSAVTMFNFTVFSPLHSRISLLLAISSPLIHLMLLSPLSIRLFFFRSLTWATTAHINGRSHALAAHRPQASLMERNYKKLKVTHQSDSGRWESIDQKMRWSCAFLSLFLPPAKAFSQSFVKCWWRRMKKNPTLIR